MEDQTATVRVYKRTRRLLNIMAAEQEKSVPEIIDALLEAVSHAKNV